jgi:hypothetical protein
LSRLAIAYLKEGKEASRAITPARSGAPSRAAVVGDRPDDGLRGGSVLISDGIWGDVPQEAVSESMVDFAGDLYVARSRFESELTGGN